ncbi:hypothetical protein KAJ27_01695 [bacterium]|nr:hypothetical protein [bacterium]
MNSKRRYFTDKINCCICNHVDIGGYYEFNDQWICKQCVAKQNQTSDSI